MNTSTPWQRLVAEQQLDAVNAALHAAFSDKEVQHAEPVTGGASGATTLRMQVQQRDYLLRVESARSPYRNPHQYTCMRIAAEAGIAPPLRHVDEQAGVAIMDFIATKPLAAFPGGPVALAAAAGRLAATLQATTPFPEFVDYRNVIRRLAERLQARCAPGLLDPHRQAFERICATLPWDVATHVSSHNDPNPRNILFDGQRLWLIDWETSYRNDPLVDVAILTDNLAATPELEGALLQASLGSEPDRELRQRLKSIRALTRLYYAGLLAAFVAPDAPLITDLAAPSREEFGRGIASGALKFTAPDTRAMLVKMSLAGFMELA